MNSPQANLSILGKCFAFQFALHGSHISGVEKNSVMIVLLKRGGGRSTTWADLVLSQPLSDESRSLYCIQGKI